MMLGMSAVNAMEFTVKSVCPMDLKFSEGYSAILQNGKSIEIVRCNCGPMFGITRLLVIDTHLVVKNTDKFGDKSAYAWFKHLKGIHEQQHGKN